MPLQLIALPGDQQRPDVPPLFTPHPARSALRVRRREAIEVEHRHRRGLAGAAFQVPGGDPHGEA